MALLAAVLTARLSQLVFSTCHQTPDQWPRSAAQPAYLSPGLEDRQCFHGGGGLAVQLAGCIPPSLDFSQRGGQELMDAPQVSEVTEHAAGDPGAAHLQPY